MIVPFNLATTNKQTSKRAGFILLGDGIWVSSFALLATLSNMAKKLIEQRNLMNSYPLCILHFATFECCLHLASIKCFRILTLKIVDNLQIAIFYA